MGDYYSYKHISTDTERQNFNRQIKSLEKYAAEHNIEYLLEIGYTVKEFLCDNPMLYDV